MKSLAVAAAALSFGSSAYADIGKQCPPDASGVCYSLSIPDSTVSSGQGDIYFQISASTSYTWVALGQGTGMTGANIFVMYLSSDGKNVTVSPRLGKGEFQPDYNSAAQINLLEGSGVIGDRMTANVLCKSCHTWSGGSMDFSSSSGNFIYAAKSGSPLKSDSTSADISQHDIAEAFTWPLATAKGGDANVNPFVVSSPSGDGSSGSGSNSDAKSSPVPFSCTPIASKTAAPSLAGPSGSGCPTTWPSSYSTAWPTSPPAWVAACYPSGLPSDQFPWPSNRPSPPQNKVKRDDGCPAGYAAAGSTAGSTATFEGSSGTVAGWMPVAHGVLASLVFVGLLPIGGILIRVANFTGLVWVHAAIQVVALVVYIIAFGMGIYMATHLGYMTNAHPILGIVLLIMLVGQPIFGAIHHSLYKKYGERTGWTYIHLFQGRFAILLGMINGGLGIQLAATASIGAKAAYAVITVLMALIYISAIIMGELRRRRNGAPIYEKSQRAHQLRELSPSDEYLSEVRHHLPKTYQQTYQQAYYEHRGSRF